MLIPLHWLETGPKYRLREQKHPTWVMLCRTGRSSSQGSWIASRIFLTSCIFLCLQCHTIFFIQFMKNNNNNNNNKSKSKKLNLWLIALCSFKFNNVDFLNQIRYSRISSYPIVRVWIDPVPDLIHILKLWKCRESNSRTQETPRFFHTHVINVDFLNQIRYFSINYSHESGWTPFQI